MCCVSIKRSSVGVDDCERVDMLLVVWGLEFEVVRNLSISGVGSVSEDVLGLDKPFPGAHLLSNLLVEVLGDDLEVPEEERSPAPLVLHDDCAVLVVRQDIVQVCRMVRAALILWCHLNGVMDYMTINSGLNNNVVHSPGGEVGRLELEGSVRVVLADLRERDVVVYLDTALTGLPEAVMAIVPVIRPYDCHIGEYSIEL